MDSLEKYFEPFRNQIIGNDLLFETPYGKKRMLYADWIASGRLYRPIEDKLVNHVGPWIANTHTETSESGTLMTKAYQYAHRRIKELVHAGPDDVIITAGSGMTTVVNKLQRILGLRTCGKLSGEVCLDESEKPVVFLTHMEHHSNQTSWYESYVDVVLLDHDPDLLVDLDELKRKLEEYKDRKHKIGAFTACSNVTGIETPYHQMAKLMHQYGGLCFVDFAASAPYTDINMHPADALEKLDAIYFSPHKFLGGPGSSGVLVFDSSLYHRKSPDNPGGGTVDWTNPWGEYKYIDDIELREDGGTPGFLQAIRAALAMELKEQMGTQNIRAREEELLAIAFREAPGIPGLKILADDIHRRLGIISFYLEEVHFNLVVKLLSDRFGIQVRGGCACARTYGHFLLNVTYDD
ncbi:MAG: aminotransferase class V-fold PLP-dependent enzyme, partial [Bacteroidales bacterium]|nr:aminotransferase class V-fold PLP-dependent enzyme [Bacteroidales bacterium]